MGFEMERRERLAPLDAARGILIMLVAVGHVLNFEYFITSAVKTVIYTFHIPAFFVLSGMILNAERSLGEQLLRRAKRLLLPYLAFEAVGALITMAVAGSRDIGAAIVKILTLRTFVGADWFLPTLFAAEALARGARKLKNKAWTAAVAVLGFAVGIFLPEGCYAVGILRRVMVAFGFVTFGALAREFLLRASAARMVLSLVFAVIIARLNGVADLSMRQFGDPILYAAGGLSGSIFVLDFAHILPKMLQKMLSLVGKQSLLIMGTHQHVLMLAPLVLTAPYSIFEQILLIFAIFLYEMLLICARKRLWKI